MWGRFSPPPILNNKTGTSDMKDCSVRMVLIVAAAVAVAFPLDTRAATQKAATPPPANQVLVQVNGVDITRGALNRYMDMMVALLKNKRRNTPPDIEAKFRKKKLAPLSNELYRRAVFSTCLAHSNITVSAAIRKEVESDCLKGYGRPKQTFEQLKAVVAKAGFAKEFEDNINFDARLRTFVTTVYSNRYYVSDAEIKKVKDGVIAFNKRAELTNQVTLAQAKAVLKQAREGADFAKLAAKYSYFDDDEERKKGGDLGDCDESDFADEKHIWLKLLTISPGSVTDVLETEDGYAIFKVVRKNKPEESQTGGESLRLWKILFRRAFQFPPQSDDEVRVDVEREVREKLLMDIYKAFRAQSKVIYPNGHIKAQ